MKLLFASDIHGDWRAAERLTEILKKEKCDKMVLCGDLLYHGARNDLFDTYDTKKTAEILNSEAKNIIAVRGNCDSEVDQMVLDFLIMADYNMIYTDDKRIFITHGHIYNTADSLKMQEGDIMVSGHTHILRAERYFGCYFLNPGSVSLPKGGNPKSYMIYENRSFDIRNFDGDTIKKLEV